MNCLINYSSSIVIIKRLPVTYTNSTRTSSNDIVEIFLAPTQEYTLWKTIYTIWYHYLYLNSDKLLLHASTPAIRIGVNRVIITTEKYTHTHILYLDRNYNVFYVYMFNNPQLRLSSHFAIAFVNKQVF